MLNPCQVVHFYKHETFQKICVSPSIWKTCEYSNDSLAHEVQIMPVILLRLPSLEHFQFIKGHSTTEVVTSVSTKSF